MQALSNALVYDQRVPKPPHLQIVDVTPLPDTPKERVLKRVRAHAKPKYMLSCHRCGGREVIVAKIGVMYRDGKAIGGTQSILCAACFMRGQRVVLG